VSFPAARPPEGPPGGASESEQSAVAQPSSGGRGGYQGALVAAFGDTSARRPGAAAPAVSVRGDARDTPTDRIKERAL